MHQTALLSQDVIAICDTLKDLGKGIRNLHSKLEQHRPAVINLRATDQTGHHDIPIINENSSSENVENKNQKQLVSGGAEESVEIKPYSPKNKNLEQIVSDAMEESVDTQPDSPKNDNSTDIGSDVDVDDKNDNHIAPTDMPPVADPPSRSKKRVK